MSRRPPPSPLAVVLAFTVLLAALTGLATPAAAFGERVYERNAVISGTSHFDVDTSQSVAQSFRATGTYRLLNVTLRLRNSGDTVDAINVSIRTDASGRPSNTRLASAQLVIGHNSLVNVAIAFAAPPIITFDVRYWIVATSLSTVIGPYEWHHSNGNAYSAGTAMTNSGVGWSNQATDMYFVTYGREVNTNVSATIRSTAALANPSDLVTFRVYLNNSGDSTAPQVWLNDTQLPGLEYVSDTADEAGATTGWPSFTFAAVGNGPRSFDIVTRVEVGTEPGTILGKALTVVYLDADGVVRVGPTSQANVLIGPQHKRVYLDPAAVGSSLRLDPAEPTGGLGSQVNRQLIQDNTVTFDLDPILSRAFDATRAEATLFLDSRSHSARDLVVNLTLDEWNGVTLTRVESTQRTVRTNGLNDYQVFSFPFPVFSYTWPAGSRIRLEVLLRGTSEDDAFLAMNSTFAASAVDFTTTTYVRIDQLDLRDAKASATVWSPKDSLVIRANVSDPLGSAEIVGAWISVVSPPGDLIVNQTAMALVQTDPGTPSAWRVFQFTIPAPLLQGTYKITVRTEEADGLADVAEAPAVVRAPSFTLSKTTTLANVQSGDKFRYDVWFNNTGSGPAGRVWINDSLPSELLFQGSSHPGDMTGDYNWTWTSLGVANYQLSIDVKVNPIVPPVPYFTNYVFLNYTDEKGFSWPTKVSSVDVALSGPVIAMTTTSTKTLLHPNEPIVYTIQLQNTGNPAGTLWVNDSLPAGLRYLSTTANVTPTVSGNLVYFRWTGMPSLSTWSFAITAIAESDLTLGETLTNRVELNYTNSNGFRLPTRSASWTVQVPSPVIDSASVAIERNSAVPTEVLRAAISFTVGGNEAARDVWLNLTLDPALRFVNATEVAEVSGSDVRFRLANVPLGPRSVAMNLSVDSNVADHHLMSVVGTLTYTDAFGNVREAITLDPDRVEASAPNLLLDVNPKETTAEAASRVFFTVHQFNAGSGVAGNVWLTLRLPPGFSSARETSGASGATLTVVGSLYTWHWTNVAPGARSIPLELTIRPTVLDGSRADVTFRMDYTDARGNFRNGENKSVFVNFIAPRVDMVVTPLATMARPGEGVDFRVSVRNTGGTTARKIWITYVNDPHAEIIRYSGLPARETWGLNWSVTDVQPGHEVTIDLTVRIRDLTPARSLVAADFTATYTNSADDVIESRGLRSTVTVEENAAPLLWMTATGAGVAVLTTLGLVRRLRTKIEEVFLVYKDGVLLYHLSRSLSADKDEDVLSGMLTAVQEFVRDAFVYGEHRELHQLDFGDYRIMIERGKNLYLAVVYSGKGASAIRSRIRTVLNHIETAYGSVLDKWDGDMDKVVGARDLIREHLLKSGGRAFRGLPGLP